MSNPTKTAFVAGLFAVFAAAVTGLLSVPSVVNDIRFPLMHTPPPHSDQPNSTLEKLDHARSGKGQSSLSPVSGQSPTATEAVLREENSRLQSENDILRRQVAEKGGPQPAPGPGDELLARVGDFELSLTGCKLTSPNLECTFFVTNVSEKTTTLGMGARASYFVDIQGRRFEGDTIMIGGKPSRYPSQELLPGVPIAGAISFPAAGVELSTIRALRLSAGGMPEIVFENVEVRR